MKKELLLHSEANKSIEEIFVSLKWFKIEEKYEEEIFIQTLKELIIEKELNFV